MALKVHSPAHAGARDQVAALVEALGDDLSGCTVEFDCSEVVVGTPSFLDEFVKQVLVERSADALRVQGASARVRELFERSAENRDVAPRLMFDLAPVQS